MQYVLVTEFKYFNVISNFLYIYLVGVKAGKKKKVKRDPKAKNDFTKIQEVPISSSGKIKLLNYCTLIILKNFRYT